MSCQIRREYKQHRPEQTPLYPLVREHLEGFLQQCRSAYGRGIPRFVERELREYLKCGIHSHGFARAECRECGHELLVAFSCKRRGVCPSCNARRMSDTAARLVDRVLPDVRLRQWVLSIPFELRIALAKNPEALSACGRIFIEEIFRWQRLVALRRRIVPPADAARLLRGGAVCFPQRFGGSLNLNVHFHVAVPDAVFLRDAEGAVQTELLTKPSRADLEDVTHNVTLRVLRWIRQRQLLPRAQGEFTSADGSETTPSPLEAFLQGSLGVGDLVSLKQGRIAKVETHSSDSVSKRVRGGEFNIHAEVTATTKEERERLLRYCARAPLSLERLSVSKCGKVIYQLRHPIRGKTHRIMEPRQFLARLCALIPPPRHPLIRFHGVLAPNSSWRKEVVPASEPEAPGSADSPSDRDVERAWESQRLDWATLLSRVYNVDALACPCGGRLKFTELLQNREEVTEYLRTRGLTAVVTAPLKKPPEPCYDFVDSLPEEDWDQTSASSSPEAGSNVEPHFRDPIWDDP